MELISSATCPSVVNKGQIRQQSIWRMMLFCWTIDIFFHSNHRSFQNAPRDGRLSLSESDSVSHIKWDLFTFFWTRTLNGAPRREKIPLISRLRCRPLARLDPCVWWKVLFQHFCCHGRAEKAGDKQGKEAVVNNLQGDGGSTQHIQTETLNFHVRVSVGSRLEVKYEHRHRRVRLKLSQCLYFWLSGHSLTRRKCCCADLKSLIRQNI